MHQGKREKSAMHILDPRASDQTTPKKRLKKELRKKEKVIIQEIEQHESDQVQNQNRNDVKKVSTNNKQNTKAQKKAFYGKRINLLVDIDKNIKAQKSKGYEQALVRNNINTLVKTMNFLMDHKITTSEDFQNYLDRITAKYAFCQKDIKKIDKELLALSEKIKFTQNYKKNAII